MLTIKKICKNMFATWCSAEVQNQADSRVHFEDLNVERELPVLKPIHATWLVETFSPAHSGGLMS